MKTVFFDVDTQLDFLFPGGALYVPGAEAIAPGLSELTRHAAARGIAIVSSLDTHRENDVEFKKWRPHCVRGTQGHQKFSGTLLTRDSARQILFEKDRIDFFPSGELDGILARLAAERFVVYGLVTEFCVRSVLFGLLERGTHVEVVTDAIGSLDAGHGQKVLDHFVRDGGKLTNVAEIVRAG